MAEVIAVVGAAASFVTLAELGFKVARLKGLWDEVQDVPDIIKSNMEEIETLRSVVSEIGGELTATDTSASGHPLSPSSSTVRICEQALCELDTLVSELSQHLKTSRRVRGEVGKLKIVLKKSIMKAAQQKLDRALNLLRMASMKHMMSVQCLYP